MSGLDNSQIITDEVSLHAEEAHLVGRKERAHVSPLGTVPEGHLPPEDEPGDAEEPPAQ
jgi:hypothetical protein